MIASRLCPESISIQFNRFIVVALNVSSLMALSLITAMIYDRFISFLISATIIAVMSFRYNAIKK